MKKRVLSLLLCIVLSLSLVPTAAFAAEDDAPASEAVTSVSTPAGDASNLCITKSVADNHDGTYSLTMEAYATGASSIKYTNVPLDIVLVLDVSGSMDDPVTAVSYKAENSASYSYKSFRNTKLFYKADDGQYYRVYRDYNWHLFSDNEYYLYYTDINGNTHVLGHTANDDKATLYTGVLYSEITATSTNMAVMQDAAKKFIGTVAANAKTNDVDHRISIVKFAGTEKNSIGNNTYVEDGYTYNYTQIVKSLTSVKDNAETLTTTIGQLTPGGATSVDYAINRASAALADSSDGRQKIVVVFTDGEPNHSRGFNGDVADAAIRKAKALKDDATIIYTVGLIQNPGTNVKNFLDYLSSNYPTATSRDSHGTKAADSYAMMADDGASLDSVFQTIAQDAISSSSQANETSILADTPTQYFKLALGEDGKLASYTAKKVPCTGEDKWGTPIDITNQIHVTHEDQTIKATGFNYTAQDNIVVEKTDGSWQGNKLVLTFTIVPDPDATWDAGEHYYNTNNTTNSKAGIYNGEEPLIQLDNSPNVPIAAYTVTYEIDGAAPASCTGMPESSTATYLPGKQITVAGGLTTTSNAKDDIHGTWTFNGWDRTGSFPMPAENVTITGRWTFTPDTHTVTFNAGDHGTIGNDQATISGTYTDGDAYPAAPSTTPEKHYEFDGWVNEAGEKVGSFPATVTADATYTATWKQVSTDPSHFDPKAAYKVEYYKEQLDGSYTLVAADSTMAFGDPGATATATVKAYEHYTLNEGMSNQSGKIIMPSLDSNNQLQILTLKLYYDLDRYTVTYKVDGEQVGEVETYKYGADVTIRDKYSKDGYDVTDWSITENFNMPANDVVITATSSINSYTVTYKVDGEVVGEVETYNFGDDVAIRDKFVKEGYTVTDWDTTDDFTMPANDVEINATSTVNSYDVIYKVDGEVVYTDSYDYDELVTVRDAYTKEGYTVTDWSITDDFNMPAENVVIEATSSQNKEEYNGPEPTEDPTNNDTPTPAPAPAPAEKTVDPDVPNTGDHMSVALWCAVMCFAMTGMAVTVVCAKKKNEAE